MFITKIPSSQVVTKIARINRDYELDFVNTDVNSDVYTLSVFLRKFNHKTNPNYKIMLVLASSILAYPALEMSWEFEDTNDDYELATRVYHRICDEVDHIKTEFDRSMAPASVLAPKIREAVKPIAVYRQTKKNQVPLDEADLIGGVSDWRMSIYSGRYPNMTKEERDKIRKMDHDQVDLQPKRRTYKTREKY